MKNQRELAPIFVAGIGRSGTSAVLKSLIHHPAVFKPEVLGEAPLIARFTEFLKEYEDLSPQKDYHLKNYKLDKDTINTLYNNLMFHITNGLPVEQADELTRYWIAKLSFPESLYSKYQEIYNGFKVIYVMRNGVEVVNSASKFHGFADLSFEQLCKRWSGSFESNDYLIGKNNCAVVKHHELVSEPVDVYNQVFEQLGMEKNDGPAEFIQTNLFNSSFKETSNVSKIKNHFGDRLQCWNDWTDNQKNTFIAICDEYMGKHQFEKPYVSPKIEILNDQPKPGKQAEKPIPIDSSGWEGLTDYMPPEQVVYSTHVSEKMGYFYAETPKVACTSIKRALQIAEYQNQGLDVPEIINPHKRSVSPLQRLNNLSEFSPRDVLHSNHFFRFCFVRNPYTRLASGYLSKIDRNLPAKKQILALLKGVPKNEITDLTEAVSFEEFVDVITDQSDYEMNAHWRPQSAQLFSNLVDYQFIGRFEQLDLDLNHLSDLFMSKYGVSLTLPKAKNKTNSSDMLDSLYTSKIIEKVKARFIDDFEQFEYSTDFQLLLKQAAS